MDRHDGFREFVPARQQALMRTAYLLTGDAHLAEDLLQSVLVKVVGQWGRLSRGGSPEAYTRKAARSATSRARRTTRWPACARSLRS
ncbi:sigma factor [Nonomuraea sp. NPDC049709]|uniref:sigma factor n=1 Tax=Nonomuraea sp. NPDC049709 TaxID=3154736 RepID=UPI003425B4BB